jgi:hypothetical protein
VEKIAQYRLDEDFPSKTISLCASDSLTELPALIHPSNAHFVLFLAIDGSKFDIETIYSVSEKLLDQGMVYDACGGRIVKASMTASTGRYFGVSQRGQMAISSSRHGMTRIRSARLSGFSSIARGPLQITSRHALIGSLPSLEILRGKQRSERPCLRRKKKARVPDPCVRLRSISF